MRLIVGPDKKKGYRCCSCGSCNKAKKAVVTKARLASAGASKLSHMSFDPNQTNATQNSIPNFVNPIAAIFFALSC